MPELLSLPLPTLADVLRNARRSFTAEYQQLGLSAFLKNNATYALAIIVARVQMQLYLGSREHASQATPFGATGANLDRFIEAYGVVLPTPQTASGTVTLTGGNSRTVPSGTVLTFQSLIYRTTTSVTFGALEEDVEVGVIADAVGSQYNRAAGDLMDLAFLTDDIQPTAVVIAVTGGQGAATEEDKERLLQLAYQRSQQSGTAGDYRLKSLQFDSQLLDIFVIEAGAGAGTVVLYPINKLNPGQESYEVNQPSAGQIAALQAYIEDPEVRKTNDRMFVFLITLTPVDFDVTISPDTADTRAAVTSALGNRLAEDYAAGGYTISNSELDVAVGGAAGVSSHTINDVDGGGPDADVVAVQGELRTLGTVTFS